MVEERLVGHEIHLKKRLVGLSAEDNFLLVKVYIPELKDVNSWYVTYGFQ
jgi:hypothetical protein